MYCQPHSGILIGTLSQATLLPPPMSPHVENPHSMSWRNRECQVTIFLLFYPCCKTDWAPVPFFSCVPPFPLPPLFFFSFFLFFFLVFLALLSCRAWPPEAGVEQPLPGTEFRAGPGAVRLAAGPCVTPEGRVSPTPAHAPAPTHPPAHLHALPCQSAPGRHPHPAHRTPHGAYPSQKCEDK